MSKTTHLSPCFVRISNTEAIDINRIQYITYDAFLKQTEIYMIYKHMGVRSVYHVDKSLVEVLELIRNAQRGNDK